MTAAGEEVSVGIVEDDPLTLRRLRARIDAAGRLRCVFGVDTVAAARAALDRYRPHVLLVDLRLGDGCGTEVLAHMRETQPDTVAMVISTLGDEVTVTQAIRAGALGYLLKDDNEAVIEASVLELLHGGSPISPAIARHLIRHFQHGARRSARSAATDARDALTPRELDVLTFAAKGYSYQEVAQLLGVTPNTVSSYTKRIYEKLAVNSRSEALFEAARLGIVAPPSTDS